MKSQVSEHGVFRVIGEDGDSWPEALSDGTSLPCNICMRSTDFDYLVEDEIWRKVVPEGDRRGVVCLRCLDRLATTAGIDISRHLLSVQYVGIGKTVILCPSAVYVWGDD